jgi:hypothetical protein
MSTKTIAAIAAIAIASAWAVPASAASRANPHQQTWQRTHQTNDRGAFAQQVDNQRGAQVRSNGQRVQEPLYFQYATGQENM